MLDASAYSKKMMRIDRVILILFPPCFLVGFLFVSVLMHVLIYVFITGADQLRKQNVINNLNLNKLVYNEFKICTPLNYFFV